MGAVFLWAADVVRVMHVICVGKMCFLNPPQPPIVLHCLEFPLDLVPVESGASLDCMRLMVVKEGVMFFLLGR